MTAIPHTSSTFLRRALQGNAGFSALSALLFILAAKPVGIFLGPVPPWMLVGAGIGLLGYAAWLWHNAGRPEVNRLGAMLAVAGDLLWVGGSAAALLYANVLGLTRGGMWAVAIVAEVVLVFAVLQFLGLRKLRRIA